MQLSDSDSAYLACRSLCDELVAAGVTDAVVSPGSRSMPLALTVDATPGLRTWIRIDERSAAHFAVGLAKGSRRPTLLVCTSGTAAANYLPAVVEAHFSGVPLIVVTADRPPELRDWGAGQTIDQHSLYGSHVRWFAETPVASELPPAQAQRWFGVAAARAVAEATGARGGPVHLNVPFREPLEPVAVVPDDTDARAVGPVTSHPAVLASCGCGAARELAAAQIAQGRHPQPESRVARATNVLADLGAVDALADFGAAHLRGVVVAGPLDDGDCWVEAVAAFCRRTGWPLLAEPCSQLRRELDGVVVTNRHDLLLRAAWSDAEAPEAVLRVGGAPTCKPLRLWIERHRPALALIDPGGTWSDASFTVSLHVRAGPLALAEAAGHIADRSNGWAGRWAVADGAASVAVDEVLDSEPLAEAGVARELGRSLAAGHALYVSNSMPVRDVDSYMRARAEPIRIYASRGASGIDGVISAAAGVAASGVPTTLLIGDLAFRHDLGGLVAIFDTAGAAAIDLTVVVVDNGGGTIFSFLPAHGVVDADAFERVLTTPPNHSSAVLASSLASALGIEHHMVTTSPELHQLLSSPHSGSGVRVVTIDIDADDNRTQHRRLADAVARALASLR